MKFTNLVLLLPLILVTFNLLSAKIIISDSVSQFRYPRFSSSGFIDWVMEGETGKVSKSKLNIESLRVRLYSRDRSNRQVGSVSSKYCTLKTADEIAYSNSNIHVKGSGFNLIGLDWKYDLNSKSITVRKNCSVEFSESIDTVFSTNNKVSSTIINSDTLELEIESNSYSFRFKGNVNLRSGSINLSADYLNIELLNNSNELMFSIPTGELSGIKSINALGSVNYISDMQRISSESLTIYPELKKGLFENDAKINIDSAILSGDVISIDQTSVNVLTQGKTRSKFTLNDSIKSKESNPTIIQSDVIKFNKNNDNKKYEFNGTVLLKTEPQIIQSDLLIVETESNAESSYKTNKEIITHCKAFGNILIENNHFKLSGGQLDFFPTKNKIVVEDSVYYSSPIAKFFTDSIIIDDDVLLAESSKRPMKVYLPDTYELGFQLATESAYESLGFSSQLAVMCHFLRIEKDLMNYSFMFRDSVHIDYNSVNLTSELLNMNWIDTNIPEQQFLMLNATAKDSVEMKQGYYFASSDILEIFPNENIITLSGNAHYKDLNGSIYGEIIDYDRNLKQTTVRNDKNNKRSRIQFNF